MKHRPLWLLGLLLLALSLPGHLLAQETATSGQRIRLQLTDFNYEVETLRSPFGDEWYGLGLPATWDLQPGSIITLDLDSFIGINSLEETQQVPLAGIVDVWFNEEKLQTIPLNWQGERLIEVALTPASLTTVRPDGRHSMYLSFRSEYDCDTLNETNVIINPETALDLAYNQKPLTLDLTRFPFPLYQRLYRVEQAVMIVPAQPTASELAAAIATATALGSISDNNLQLSLVTIDEFTQADYSQHHLIVIGRQEAFSQLGLNTLPPVAETALRDQGILYLTTSPLNVEMAMLFVSGADDTLLTNAAYALSSGRLRTTESPNVSIINRVNDLLAEESDMIEFSINNDNEPMIATATGENRIERFFTLPANTQPSGSGELILRFQHSALLDYDRSGLTVYLNETPVGSARLTDETARNGEVNIRLTRSAFVAGENELSIRPNLIPRGCSNLGDTSLWFTVGNDSTIKIQLEPLSIENSQTAKLSNYPGVFTQRPNMQDVTFLLPRNNSVAWNAAVQLASDMGDSVNLNLFRVQTFFSDEITQETLDNNHLILVGQASEFDLIQDIAPVLPAPYAMGENRPDQSKMPVIFNDETLPDVGYIQITQSPYNPLKSIMLVNGSSNAAVLRSVQMLANPPDNLELAGDVAIVDANQMVTADISGIESIPSADTIFVLESERENTIVAPEPFEEPAVEYTPPAWIDQALQGALGVIVIVVLAALLFERRGKKQKPVL